MSLDFRFILLLAIFVLYGIGYIITGVFNTKNTWTMTLFKVPFIFAIFGVRIGRVVCGLICIGGAIWFYTLLM